MGYVSGVVIGISIGYFLTSWKHEWFMKTFGKPEKMDKDRKNGAEKLNLSSPNCLKRFLNLCILLLSLELFFLLFFLFSRGVTSITCVYVG